MQGSEVVRALYLIETDREEVIGALYGTTERTRIERSRARQRGMVAFWVALTDDQKTAVINLAQLMEVDPVGDVTEGSA